MKNFYAAHECANMEIAIFHSKEERDEWVNHEDWFSKEFDTEDDRVALSAKEAYQLIGKALYDTANYITDNLMENIMWAIATTGEEATLQMMVSRGRDRA